MALPSKKTHKIILATYAREVLYAVPNDWDAEDIMIRDGILYLEGGAQDVPKFELDPERIPEKIEHADWEPYDEIDAWFDCEEDDWCECCRCSIEIKPQDETKMVGDECWCLACYNDEGISG